MQKTTLLFLLIGVLVAGCQKADEASEIVGDKQPMLEIIPTAKLGEWDEGYLINSSIVFAFKHIDKTEKEDGHYVGFFTNIDGTDKVDSYDVGFEADEDFYVRYLFSDDDSWQYEYVKDSVYVTHYKKDSDEHERRGYLLADDAVAYCATKAVSAETAKLILTRIDNVDIAVTGASFVENTSVTTLGAALTDLGIGLMQSYAVDILVAAICPGLAIPIMLLTTGYEMAKFYMETQKIKEDMPFIGLAYPMITSFTDNEITVTISKSFTLPDDMSGKTIQLYVAVKNVGRSKRGGSISLNSADFYKTTVVNLNTSSVTVALPKLKFGYYIASPYLICDGHSRLGDSAGFYCSNLDELPTYSVDRYTLKSTGTGKITANVTMRMYPLDMQFYSQSILFYTKKSSELLCLNTRFGTTETKEKSLQVDDFSIDYPRKTASLMLTSVYKLLPSTGVEEAFYYDLPSTILTYSEKPLIRFENVRIDRTEKHTEKKKSVMGNISFGNSSPNPNPDPDEDEEITYYETYFTASYTLEGGFWIKTVANECTGTVSTSGLTVISSGESGKYKDKFKGVLKYNSEKEINDASISCRMTLMNGETVNSINSLFFSGGEEITDAICK